MQIEIIEPVYIEEIPLGKDGMLLNGNQMMGDLETPEEQPIDYSKSTFKITDNERVFELKPEDTLNEISELKDKINVLHENEMDERLRNKISRHLQNELFLKKRNIKRLENEYGDFSV